MRIPKPKLPGADKLLFALAGLALGAGALSWWENREPVEVEPEPDVVVGVTLFCEAYKPSGGLFIETREDACERLLGAPTGADTTFIGISWYYRLTVKSDGFAYEVEVPNNREYRVGDAWPQ